MKPSPELIYEYSMARKAADEDQRRRITEARSAVPRLGAIAAERREAVFSTGLLIMKGDRPGLRDAELRIAELNAEESMLLERHGYPPDQMQPRYRCPRCKDTGYTDGIERQLCACMRSRIAKEKYASSSIDPEESFKKFRMDIYPTERQRKISQKALEICKNYAADFPKQSPRDILLMGNTGLGKSYLLNAIALEVSERGYRVYKTSAYNLINSAMEAMRERKAPMDFIEPDLLVIDDLGTEPMIRSVTIETLFSVLNERQSAGRATAWATNLSVENIRAGYDDRFFSRLVAPRFTAVLPLEGSDLRLKLK